MQCAKQCDTLQGNTYWILEGISAFMDAQSTNDLRGMENHGLLNGIIMWNYTQ